VGIRKYKVIEHSWYFGRDEIVYDCIEDDKGHADNDTKNLGTEFISVTSYPDGKYPFATIEKTKLKLVE
jgi:hypothetical protein